MSADRPRYRPPQPDEEEPESTPVGEHTHKQSRSVLFLTVSVIVLLLANTGILVYAYNVDGRLSNLESFVADAKVKRDRQNIDVNERITKVVCDILDGLPAGPLFDPKRQQYGCGPGIPVEELSPEVLANLQQFGSVVQPPQDRLKPVPDSAAQPAEPLQELPAQPAPAASTPAPTVEPTPGLPPVEPTPAPVQPSAPPLVDLGGLTDAVCGLTGVCA